MNDADVRITPYVPRIPQPPVLAGNIQVSAAALFRLVLAAQNLVTHLDRLKGHGGLGARREIAPQRNELIAAIEALVNGERAP